MRAVAAEGHHVRVNGAPFVRVCSPALADFLASLIQHLASLPPSRREPAIEAALAGLTDVDAVVRRFDQARRATRALRWTCTLLFLYLFTLLPALVWWEVPYQILEVLAGYLILLTFVKVGFYAAHRRLRPHDPLGRWKQLAVMLLSPADAVHARDPLFRDLVSTVHPLTAALALCPEREARTFARRVLLDLRHPLAEFCPSDDPARRETEAWFRSRLGRALEDLVRRQGLDPDELIRPPPPEEAGCRSYCPRCDGQFLHAAGACPYCPGVALRAWAAEDKTAG